MISYLSGKILTQAPPTVCVEVGGVGYDVDVSMTTYYQLGSIGSMISLFIHMVVREDAHLLYGFLTTKERELFRKILKISGVGPRIALAILSGLSVDQFVQAVLEKDSHLLQRIPGIGKKTSERILLELQDKLDPKESIFSETSTLTEIAQALIALGYSEKEIKSCLAHIPIEVTLTDGIRLALKKLTQN